jgi:DNA (cytosine-5)-methyltransferase 1
MDAQYMGVPQTRQRLIFIGIRQDLNIEPSHPKPDTLPMAAGDALGLDHYELELKEGYGNVVSRAKPAGTFTRIHPPVLRTRSMSINRWRPGPAATITATSSDYAATEDGEQSRKLTIAEAKILQGFPADFVLEGTYTQQWARIGNSVAPPMMERVARHVRSLLADADGMV